MRWFLVTDCPLTANARVTCVRHACGTIAFAEVLHVGQSIRFGAVSDLFGNILDPHPEIRPGSEYPYPEDDDQDLLSLYWQD